MNPNRNIADLSEARLTKLLAERAALSAKIVQTDVALHDLCRRYSLDNGYRVTLRPDQMKRAIEAERGP